uniref:Pentatricopeptide repeat-containing protein n=1 Tax=Vitis vinifera TaxID=29760 RepID=F6HH51_VITVI
MQTGKESMPDDESYELVVGMLFLTDQIDAALRYVDLTLKSGYMLSMRVFAECVRSCVNKGRLDALVSIIERCKPDGLLGVRMQGVMFYSLWMRGLLYQHLELLVRLTVLLL